MPNLGHKLVVHAPWTKPTLGTSSNYSTLKKTKLQPRAQQTLLFCFFLFFCFKFKLAKELFYPICVKELIVICVKSLHYLYSTTVEAVQIKSSVWISASYCIHCMPQMYPAYNLSSQHMCCSQGHCYVGYRIWLKCILLYAHVSFRRNCTAL